MAEEFSKRFLDFSTIPFPVVWNPQTIFPGLYEGNITISHAAWKWGNFANDAALVFLCHLAKLLGGPIVEIGTFEGRTTINLARNIKLGRITTIDLGRGGDDESHVNGKTYGDYVPGRFIIDAEPKLRARVDIIIADSTAYDFSDHTGRANIFIVDGGHSYSVIQQDMTNALASLAPGGVVVIDDYGPRWPDVMDYINEKHAEYPMHYLAREGLVIHVKKK